MLEQKSYAVLENGLPFDFVLSDADNSKNELQSESSELVVEGQNVDIEEQHSSPLEEINEQRKNMDEMLNQKSSKHLKKIVVIGVGGGGCNAIEYLYKNQFYDVSLVKIDANYDSFDTENQSIICIPLSTDGYGSGGDVAKATAWVEQSEEKIRQVIEPANLVFIVSSLGGGTGTGAMPVIAELAQKMDKLTIALLNTPSSSIVNHKQKAQDALNLIEKNQLVDALMVIPNDRLATHYKDKSIDEAYNGARIELLDVLIGINSLLDAKTNTKIDFNDLHSALNFKGKALFGCAEVEGNKGLEQLREAFEKAKNESLFETNDFQTARGLLLNIQVAKSPTMSETDWLEKEISQLVSANQSMIKWNWKIDEDIEENRLMLTFLATGIDLANNSIEKQDMNETVLSKETKNSDNSHQNVSVSSSSTNSNFIDLENKKKQLQERKSALQPNKDDDLWTQLDELPAILRKQRN